METLEQSLIGRLLAGAVAVAALLTAGVGGVAPAAAGTPTARVVPLACHGSLAGQTLNRPIVGITAAPDNGGYWLVASDGGVFSFGDAQFYGSTGNIRLNQPIVGMASTVDGHGYWLVASEGGVFSYGDAQFYGSTGNIRLNQPIVGMAATPDGGGYWLVASDGGVFSYGDAQFYGSTGNIRLNQPVVAMGTTHDGKGYWLVAADAGVFSYGDARYLGGGPVSQDGVAANNFSAFAAATDGSGYLIASSNRAFLLNFGSAQYFGLGYSAADTSPLAGISAPNAAAGYGYWEATQAGSVYALGASGQSTC